MKQLSELDPGGEDFRYAMHKDGSPSLAKVDRLDVKAFHEAMEGVASFLAGVNEQAAYELELKEEIEQEMRREVPSDY